MLLFSPGVATVIDVSLFCLFVLPWQNQWGNSHSAATLALNTKQQWLTAMNKRQKGSNHLGEDDEAHGPYTASEHMVQHATIVVK